MGRSSDTKNSINMILLSCINYKDIKIYIIILSSAVIIITMYSTLWWSNIIIAVTTQAAVTRVAATRLIIHDLE